MTGRRSPELDALAGLPAVYRDRLIGQLPRYAQDEIDDRWPAWAHDGQTPPDERWRV